MEPIIIKKYTEEVKKYGTLASQASGKPQNLAVVRNSLFWTQGKQQKLYEWPADGTPSIPVKPVFVENTEASVKTYNKEEELLRERMRSVLTGISSFKIRESDGAVFYIANQTNLFIYYTTGPRSRTAPLNVFSFIPDSERFLAGKPCMHISHISDNKDLTDIVFVHNSNLYRAHITEQPNDVDAPLVVEVLPITTIGDDHHQCGVADYITQEEFDRYLGHYENKDYVVFSYIDTSMMRKVNLLKSDAVEEMQYPRVGDENAKTTIVVYHMTDHTYRYLPACVIQKSIAFDAEYIPRFGFKNHDTIFVEVLSRTQEECATLSYPIASLQEITEGELLQVYTEIGGKSREFFPPLHVEMEQSIPWAWVDIVPYFPIIFGSRFDITLRSATETETAHFHLYIRPVVGSATSWKPLTTGAWNVKPGMVKVRGDRVTFAGNAGSRLHQGLFTVMVPQNLYEDFIPFDEANITAVSPEGEFVNSFEVTDDKVFYCSSSAMEGAKLRVIEYPSEGDCTPLEASTVPTDPWIEPLQQDASGTFSRDGLPITLPIIVTVKNNRGVPISAAVYMAPSSAPCRNTEAGAALALYVYGGPHVQLVMENNCDSYMMPAVQCLVNQGISVAVVDNQMSNANGLRALSICKKNMGQFETEDYVCLVKELCSSPVKLGLPSNFKVDPGRIGIFGWSYGGYATLLAMSQAPHVFRMGFSGAPVGDWRLYDTGYTERYMGTLKDKKTCTENEAYEKGAIAHFAAGFPDDIDRVFIAHGLLDENVHFTNSCLIISALVEHGKPYSMLLYPGERHGLRQNPLSRPHHDALMIKTIAEKL